MSKNHTKTEKKVFEGEENMDKAVPKKRLAETSNFKLILDRFFMDLGSIWHGFLIDSRVKHLRKSYRLICMKMVVCIAPAISKHKSAISVLHQFAIENRSKNASKQHVPSDFVPGHI